jgi:hypothetical protein
MARRIVETLDFTKSYRCVLTGGLSILSTSSRFAERLHALKGKAAKIRSAHPV